MINWDTAEKESQLIRAICIRAAQLKLLDGDLVDLLMDITATHCNGTPLDLQKFLDFDDFNFAHDIVGIRNHINRDTGKIERCFLPRCSRPASKRKAVVK